MFQKNKKSLLLLLFIFSLFFLFSFVVKAERPLEVNYPTIFGQKITTTGTTLPEYVKYIFNFAVMISGIIALSVLIWGGFTYLISTGNPSQIKKAREQIFGGIVGLIILLSSYLILYNINPATLIFNFPSLRPIVSTSTSLSFPVVTKNASLITEELPLGQAANNGLLNKTKTEDIKNLITNFQSFLVNEKKGVRDVELSDPHFDRISDLNKYLKTLTDECRCENLTALCTKPEVGSLPVGCNGDPCQTDQSDGVEAGSPRARINNILKTDRDRIKTLLDYKKKINEQKKILEQGLRKFQLVEEGVIACQDQNGELKTLNEYLTTKKNFDQTGDQLEKIYNYWPPRENPFTFYCSSGGTVYDYPYLPEKRPISPAELNPQEIAKELTGPEKISCPLKLPSGEVLDSLRELTIIMVVKLERASLLTETMIKQVEKMTELVSKCNETGCGISCACVPNPCYTCCSPFPCGPCVIFCKDICLQAVGVCHGDACPVEDIEKETKNIKETEDKILATIENIKEIFPQVPPLLVQLNNISVSTGLCYSPDINNPTWTLLNCEQAMGNYGPSGQMIGICHPRDFYCCSLSGEKKNPFPPPANILPGYIIKAEKFTPLSSEDNCPKGWTCSHEVKFYNEYNDSSEPLKKLLACMRKNLDKIQEEEELREDEIIGKIASITDAKLYRGTCDWEGGPKEDQGCSYSYEIEHGRERISAHYGGTYCRYNHKSYALEFDLSTDFQKKYMDKIINSAKECSPGAYILNRSPYLHIDIGNVYHCGSNDF